MAATRFDELLADCEHDAWHLEMRDGYTVTHPGFVGWRQGHRLDLADRASWWRPWLDKISAAVARGIAFRRARIVSEPLSEYIRWEHEESFANIAAGEEIRWLPRARASTIALPGNDFWLFDRKVVLFNIFAGDGSKVDEQVTDDPDTAALCATSFTTVWQQAIPHERYRPT